MVKLNSNFNLFAMYEANDLFLIVKKHQIPLEIKYSIVEFNCF